MSQLQTTIRTDLEYPHVARELAKERLIDLAPGNSVEPSVMRIKLSGRLEITVNITVAEFPFPKTPLSIVFYHRRYSSIIYKRRETISEFREGGLLYARTHARRTKNTFLRNIAVSLMSPAEYASWRANRSRA